MSLQFRRNDSEVDSLSLKFRSLTRGGDIPKSDELSGIELRLSRVLIKENGTPKVPPFPGLAQIYLLVIVITSKNFPLTGRYFTGKRMR